MSVEHFRRRLFHAQAVVFLLGAFRGVVVALAGISAAAMIQFFVEHVLTPSVDWVRGSWVILAATLMVLFLFILKDLWSSCRIPTVAMKLGAQPADVFLTAWELERQNISGEFRLRAVTQADQTFPGNWLGRLVPARWFLKTGSLLLGLFLLLFLGRSSGTDVKQALWPFGPRSSGILSVSPGNSFFPRGEDVAVSVRVSTGEFAEPRLDVREKGMGWEERPILFVSPGHYSTTLRSLQNRLEYRWTYGRGHSARYRLIPFEPPKLLHLAIEIDPPRYSGRKTEHLEDVLSLQVLSGSRVRWSFLLDPSDGLLRFAPEPSTPILKKGAEWSFSETVNINQDREVWARLKTGTGEVWLAALSVEAVPDEPPQVTLLAPNEDLEAEKSDLVPLSIELTEDVGLSQMGISYQINQGKWRTEGRKRFAPGTVHAMEEIVFDLAKTGVKAGDHLKFYLWARDHRTPPQEGRTESRSIDILDYKAIHDQVLVDLESFQNFLRDRMAEEKNIRENVGVSTPAWGGLLTEQRQVARRLKNEEERLRNLLDRMALDPGTDQGTLIQHQGLAESLNALNRTTLPEVDRQVVAQDPGASMTALDQALSELKRMGRLSAQAVQEQRLRQLLRDQSQLSNQAENLTRSLEERPSLSDEQAQQFQEAVQAMQETLDRIRARLEELRKSFSEEQLKNATVEVARFDQVNKSLRELTQALQQKKAAEALSAARNALDQLRQIENQLNRAWNSLSFSGAEIGAALSEEQDQLTQLVHRQESLLDQSRDLVDKKHTRFLAHQSETLQRLQRAASRWETQWGDSATPEFRLLGILAKEITRAIESGQGNVVLERLREFVTQTKRPHPEKSAGSENAEWASPAVEAHLFLDELTTKKEEGNLTEVEQENLPRWAQEQQGLAGDARLLSEKIKGTVRETSLLMPSLPRQISTAALRMDDAALALKALEVLIAQDNQEKALELLRDAREKLSQALNQAQSVSRGAGGAPSLRRKGGGAFGGSSGDVKIPRGDDFRPPTEFRQEVLDSMKEVYPKEEEGPVQNYYRHWTK